jgi:hypothetical protein
LKERKRKSEETVEKYREGQLSSYHERIVNILVMALIDFAGIDCRPRG